jgi:hypothetical protein
VSKVTRLTIVNSCQTMVFVALGATQGMVAVGLAMVLASAVAALYSLRVTALQLGLPLRDLLRALRLSMQVALLAAVGPALVLAWYGLYTDERVLPLLLGGAGSLAGLVLGVLLFKHPLQDELQAIGAKFQPLLARWRR